MRQTLKHWILCRIQKDQETSSAIKRLHPREEGEKILFNTWKKRIQQIAVLLALTIILLIYCASRTENNPVLKENQYPVTSPLLISLGFRRLLYNPYARRHPDYHNDDVKPRIMLRR